MKVKNTMERNAICLSVSKVKRNMAEAAFSKDGKYYSAISTDGRLNIWDTETNELKQQYTPDLHLTSPPSCLHWITVTVSGGETQKQKKKKATSENEIQCIALGTHSGKILLYSVAQAKIESILSGRIFSKVTALDWDRKYGLYSCSKDDMVVEWDIENAEPRNQYKIAVENKNKQGNSISAIKIVPHKLETEAHYLVAASWQVRLWRLHKGDATVVKTLGHNASQTALLTLATVNDVCWLIEGSQNERLLSFWDITITEDHNPIANGDEPTPKKQKKRKKSLTNVPTVTTPTYNFVLEDAPRIVDANLREEDGLVKLSLAAGTRSGVVHYYAHTLNGSSVKPMKPSVTIQATTADAVPYPLKCCRLQPSGDLLLGYSKGPNMAFENVTPDLKSKTQVLIRGTTKPTNQKQADQSIINKVRSDNEGRVQLVEPVGLAGRKRIVPGAGLEVAMEARLSNLSLAPNTRPAALSSRYTKLLMQGLHSRDYEIIQSVLCKNSVKIARGTVEALPAEYVPALLNELANMAVRKTSYCLRVCTWLHAVLQAHAALLLALMHSEHAQQLTHLLAIFTNRRSHLCQLMNLKGRLNMTIKQRNAAAKHNKTTMKPIMQYIDASSDDEMVVNNDRKRSDSEGSWNDEKFKESDDDEQMDQDNTHKSSDDDENDSEDDDKDSDDSDNDSDNDGSSDDAESGNEGENNVAGSDAENNEESDDDDDDDE